jgi:hypothetical protein
MHLLSPTDGKDRVKAANQLAPPPGLFLDRNAAQINAWRALHAAAENRSQASLRLFPLA